VVPTQFESLGYVNQNRVLIASERTVMYNQKAKQVKLKRVEKLKN
jgi:hypothetical protein